MSQLHDDTGKPINTGDTVFDDTGKPVSQIISPSTIQYHGAIVYHSTTQTYTSGVGAVQAYDSEVVDTDGYHSTSSNNSRITIPSGLAGYYVIGGNLRWAINATGYRSIRILKNGSSAAIWTVANGSGAINIDLHLSTTLSLVAGDYIEIFGQQGSGGNLDTQASGTIFTFWANLIGVP